MRCIRDIVIEVANGIPLGSKESKKQFPQASGFVRRSSPGFSDILSFTYDDEVHSHAERRYATLGMSGRQRVLVVAHTMRGEQVRIISAREATPRERRWYEKENK